MVDHLCLLYISPLIHTFLYMGLSSWLPAFDSFNNSPSAKQRQIPGIPVTIDTDLLFEPVATGEITSPTPVNEMDITLIDEFDVPELTDRFIRLATVELPEISIVLALEFGTTIDLDLPSDSLIEGLIEFSTPSIGRKSVSRPSGANRGRCSHCARSLLGVSPILCIAVRIVYHLLQQMT